MNIEEKYLIHEAKYFYKLLFSRTAHTNFINNYIRVHQEANFLFSGSLEEYKTVSKIVKKKLNAVAIEPWLRKFPHRHIISRKLLLVLYLAECDGNHLDFREIRHKFPYCYIFLIQSLLSGIVILIWGWVQKKFNDHI